MRTTSRLVVSAAVLGSGLLIGAPASAHEHVCPYPMTNCPTTGGGGTVVTGGGGTVVKASTTRGGALPFTGGEVTLMALAGTAALGGGIVLVAAGRKRATA